MKVFISYSVADVDLVKQVLDAIRAGGDEPRCWETSRAPGQEVWPSIFEWIDSSDLVLAIITDKTVARAMAVGQEVGHARAKGKHIVPLVTSDVKPEDLGCLSNLIFQPVSRDNTKDTLAAVETVIKKRKMKEEEARKQLVAIASVIGLIWLCAKSG
jgi:hypothetical protein